MYIIHNECVRIWTVHADACSDRLPLSHGRQRELGLSKNYNVSFPARMLGSEEHFPKNFYRVFKHTLTLLKCSL